MHKCGYRVHPELKMYRVQFSLHFVLVGNQFERTAYSVKCTDCTAKLQGQRNMLTAGKMTGDSLSLCK